MAKPCEPDLRSARLRSLSKPWWTRSKAHPGHTWVLQSKKKTFTGAYFETPILQKQIMVVCSRGSQKKSADIVATSEKWAKRGDFSQPALGHSNECRTRIDNFVREDPEMKDLRKELKKERKNRYVAERVEQALTKQETEAAQSSHHLQQFR